MSNVHISDADILMLLFLRLSAPIIGGALSASIAPKSWSLIRLSNHLTQKNLFQYNI